MTITYPTIKMTLGEEEFIFSKEEIMSATLIEELCPISVTLPISTIEFKIISTDTTFSMFEGEYFELLAERSPVLVYENIDGTPYLLGKFYLSEWENISEYEFRFKAIDVIGILDATDYDGNFWEGGVTLSTVLANMLNPLNVLYTLDDTIAADEPVGWIPPGTYRTALQQLCFSHNATATATRSDRLQIVPLTAVLNTYDYKILNREKLLEQPIELQPLVTSIELISHDYTAGEVLEDIFEQELAIGSYKIIFEKPYYDIVVDGPGYTPTVLGSEGGDYIMSEGNDYIEVGGEYIFGPNSLYLELTEGGTVTVTGFPWLDSKQGFIFRETGLTEYANKNALKIEEATLIHTVLGPPILSILTNYYRQRYRKTITLLPSQVKVGDILLTETISGKMVLGMVEKMTADLVGGYLAETEILGVQYPGISLEPASYSLTGTDAILTYSGEE